MPLMMPLAVESNGCAVPSGDDRYAPTSAYTALFQYRNPLRPATSPPSVPSISVDEAEPGDTAELTYGKPQAGVLFHRSCTVGLLLILSPNVVGWDASVPCVANRRLVLSRSIDPDCGSYVSWTKAPIFGVMAPARKTLSWSGSSTLPLGAPFIRFCSSVSDACAMIETIGIRLSDSSCRPALSAASIFSIALSV